MGTSQLFTYLAALSLAGAMGASTVDFQDVSSGNCAFHGSTLTSQGFSFAGNPVDANLFVCNAGVLQHNTSAALINANSQSILTMTQVGGGAFSLESFFAGGRTAERNPDGPVSFYTPANGLEVLGNLAGGGTVSFTVALDDVAPYEWKQFVLPGTFINLSSVVFTALGQGSTPEFLIDDISVNSVPEPATVGLLMIGALGVTYGRRRNRLD